ncbi:hypothetical protein [Pyxidicoccus sp. MSG2]|uniref:hypothetical protein n=1 Tax=Pyxidicoccus sp. MSG2 TaxID=2996790 RepID=UPI00226FC41F|nr:hypothetical protein [Pyxidicoccus sp. MSG2]MCY1019639.1 hypothetical protein [Pyxidicoccus sp. MSG2]
MRQGARRWVVGLLAGGVLAAAGCRGGERNREGRAFETPQQDAARPLGTSNEHPATSNQAPASGQLARDMRLGGVTAGPNTPLLGESAGGLPQTVVAGLGTNLADAYRVSPPGGEPATGGSGKEGGPAAPGGATAGPANPGKGAGGAGSAGGGQQDGAKGRK